MNSFCMSNHEGILSEVANIRLFVGLIIANDKNISASYTDKSEFSDT